MKGLFDISSIVLLLVLGLRYAHGDSVQVRGHSSTVSRAQSVSKDAAVTNAVGEDSVLRRTKRDAKVQPLLKPLLLRRADEETARRLSIKDKSDQSRTSPKVPEEKTVRIDLTVKDGESKGDGTVSTKSVMGDRQGETSTKSTQRGGGSEKIVDLEEGPSESVTTTEDAMSTISTGSQSKGEVSTSSSGDETTVEPVTSPVIPATTEPEESTTTTPNLEIITISNTSSSSAFDVGKNKKVSDKVSESNSSTQNATAASSMESDTPRDIKNTINMSQNDLPPLTVTEASNLMLSTLMDYDGNTGLRTLLKQRFKSERISGLSRDTNAKAQITSLNSFNKFVTPAKKEESVLNVTENSTTEAEISEATRNATSANATSNLVPELLQDIKGILLESVSHQHQNEFSTLELRYDMLQHMTTSKIETVEESLENFVVHTDQKLDLVIENLSTLKILAIGQNEQVSSNVEKIKEFKERLDQLQERQTKAASVASEHANLIEKEVIASLKEDTSSEANVTSDVCSVALGNLTALVESNDAAQQGKFMELNVKIVQIEESLSSYEGKLDRHFMRNRIAETNKSVCSCNVSSLQNEVIDLRDVVNSQSLLINILQSSSSSLQNDIDELKQTNTAYKLSLLKETEGAATKLPSSSSNTAEDVSTQINQANRIQAEVAASVMELVNARMANFEEELKAVRDLRDEVAQLQRQLLNQELRNETALTGLCVWPYKPGASGCYHVNTEERMGWAAARTKCQAMQGDLATPPHFDDFKKHLMGQRLSRSYSFWVGSNNHDQGNQWLWLDGRSVGKEVWATGQPNQLRSDTCMEVRPDLRFYGADEACRVPNYFICQQRGT